MSDPGSDPHGYGYGGSGWSGYGAGPEYPAAAPTGYGAPGSGTADPGGTPPPDTGLKGRATVAFVVSLAICILCCGALAGPGVAFAGFAMGKADVDPYTARNLTKWAWISLTIGVGVGVLFVVVFVIILANGGFDST